MSDDEIVVANEIEEVNDKILEDVPMVLNQSNSYYEPIPRTCEDDAIPHGLHIYMRKDSFGSRVWYQCEGWSLE